MSDDHFLGLLIAFLVGILVGIGSETGWRWHIGETQASAKSAPEPALSPAALACLYSTDDDFCKGFKLGSGWEQCAAWRAQPSMGKPLPDPQKVAFVGCIKSDGAQSKSGQSAE